MGDGGMGMFTSDLLGGAISYRQSLGSKSLRL
jgi:hypothetical protein